MEAFAHLPRCVDCKRGLAELDGVLLFRCHFCMLCLKCVHYYLAIRSTKRCAVCGNEVQLRSLKVDDKLTTLAILFRFSLNAGFSGEAQAAWISHYNAQLEEYAHSLFPQQNFRFSSQSELSDFSERQESDPEKQPDLTEKGWLCESCGRLNRFETCRCEGCGMIQLALHSLLTNRPFALPADLVEILKFKEVKIVQSQK